MRTRWTSIEPWKLSVSAVRFDLTNFKKDKQTRKCINSSICNLEYPLSDCFSFTDGSKREEGVAAATVSTKRINKPFTCQLPDDSSIYTAELRVVLLALKHVYCYKRKIVFDI